MVVRAKLCGIRSDRDLAIAVRAGADAIGLICGVTHLSEDALEPDEARRLAWQTPPFVSRILVTHLQDADEILERADYIGVDGIQVHGLVTLEQLASVFQGSRGRRVARTVHVQGPDALDAASQVAPYCDAVQLDSRTEDRLGGTGQIHDWSISREIVEVLKEHQRPVIMSGGLRPENIYTAIDEVRPFAVDVNSGVDNANGDKDPERCLEFVSRARESLVRSSVTTA